MTDSGVSGSNWSFGRLRAPRIIIVALLLGAIPVTPDGYAAPKKIVIVDTDMALDDARAIVLLTQGPSIEIAVVITSDGSSSPRQGAKNVLALLRALGKGDVLVGTGTDRNVEPPPWRAMSETLGGDHLPAVNVATPGPAKEVLKRVCSEHPEGVTYICLGPLSNLADLVRADSALAVGAIRRVYLEGDCGVPEWTSWNTRRDTAAARVVMGSGLPVYSATLPDSLYLRFSESILARIEKCSSPASRIIADMHHDPGVKDLVHSGHFRCWDETVALVAMDSTLARFASADETSPCQSLIDWDAARGERRYLELLGEREEAMDRSQVILSWNLTDPAIFPEDIRQIADSVIRRYGPEEWRAAVLTTEIHGHLGIYSILGAKMGIRALELLKVSTDEVRVTSSAGHEPPLSCLHDGLQVSTGATLGQASIEVASGDAVPSALFTNGQRHLRLTVMRQISGQIADALRQLVQRCGGLTPEYWVRVRELSIQYWRDLDRREIFDESWE